MKTCKACFMRDCDCPCSTCEAVRLRNRELSQQVLDLMNIFDGFREATENAKTSESPSQIQKDEHKSD